MQFGRILMKFWTLDWCCNGIIPFWNLDRVNVFHMWDRHGSLGVRGWVVVGKILRMTPSDSHAYITSSPWVWWEPVNVMNYYFHDYITLYDKHKHIHLEIIQVGPISSQKPFKSREFSLDGSTREVRESQWVSRTQCAIVTLKIKGAMCKDQREVSRSWVDS